jgi:uncharacterized protein (TIGR02001 family)
MRVKSFPLRTLSLAVALSVPMVAAHADGDSYTGNIGVFSKYILRGVTSTDCTSPYPCPTAESDNAVLQGGFDYVAANGIYAGYWGSTLGYGTAGNAGNGVENDLYAGWGGKSGDISYSLGLIQYYYMNVGSGADLIEFNPTIGYGPVTLGAKTLLKKGVWGNQGDTYWTASYSTDLPSNFKFGAVLGYYSYDKSANAEMCGTDSNGAALKCTTESSAFRHVDLTLAHPIAKTGADMSMTYTLAGKNRVGIDMKDTIWFGVKYGFDL